MQLSNNDYKILTRWKHILSINDIKNIKEWENYQTNTIFLKNKYYKPIFQNFVENNKHKEDIIYEDDKVMIFIPKTKKYKNHILVIPKKRIFNAITLTKKDINLLKYMMLIGRIVFRNMLTKKKKINNKITLNLNDIKNNFNEINNKINTEKIQCGFHIYPDGSVDWLHLHVYSGKPPHYKKFVPYFPANKILNLLED